MIRTSTRMFYSFLVVLLFAISATRQWTPVGTSSSLNEGDSSTGGVPSLVWAYYGGEINPYPTVAFVWSNKDRFQRKAQEMRSALVDETKELIENAVSGGLNSRRRRKQQRDGLWGKSKNIWTNAVKNLGNDNAN